MEKKPLYRKVSKTTHNGLPNYDFNLNERSSWSRHTKKGMKRGMNTKCNGNGNGLYDYTPLFKFLLKQEGKDWDGVWKECVSRLNTTEPVLYMVLNVRSNGLVCRNCEMDTSEEGVDWKGMVGCKNKCFRYGEGTYFSTMYVDENNKLQFVDKNYVAGPNYEVERKWGETFNGNLYETYKRPEEKVRKMKSYIVNK